jgi:hypothetical protein
VGRGEGVASGDAWEQAERLEVRGWGEAAVPGGVEAHWQGGQMVAAELLAHSACAARAAMPHHAPPGPLQGAPPGGAFGPKPTHLAARSPLGLSTCCILLARACRADHAL